MRAVRQLVPGVVAFLALVQGASPVAHGSPAPGIMAGPVAGQAEVRLLFDATRYSSGDCASIRLFDPQANQNPDVTEEVPVTVFAQSGDQEPLALLETSVASGVFATEKCLPVLESKDHVMQDGTLQVDPGDMVGAVQMDGDKAPRSADVAIVPGGEPNGKFEIAVDPKVLPEGLPTETDSGIEGEPPFPLAAVQDPSGSVAVFGADQLVYRAASPRELKLLVERRQARPLNQIDIPVGKEGGNPDQEEPATFSLLRVDAAGYDTKETAFLLGELGFEGTWTFSSDLAARLFGLIVEEQLTGSAVGPSTMLLPHSTPFTNEGSHPNAFSGTWYGGAGTSRRINTREGLGLMAVTDNTTRAVGTAIVDGGFAGPGDYPAPPWTPAFTNPDYGTAFATASRCDFSAAGIPNCAPGSAAGTNPLSCTGGTPCPWHGLQMFSAAGAALNNGFGAAGSGGSVVFPMLYKIGLPYLTPAAAAITKATLDGARVINLSSGFPCAAVLIDICSPGGAFAVSLVAGAVCPLLAFIPVFAGLGCPSIIALVWGVVAAAGALDAATAFAESRGVVVVASAGNNNGADAAAERMVPCTMQQVVCVGALSAGSSDLVAASFSDTGAAIDIWSPGVGVPVTPDPTLSPPPNANLGSSNGTSPAAAFITGVVADIRSINPGLGAPAVRAILASSRCNPIGAVRLDGTVCTPSMDPLVRTTGFVDVLQAVRLARISAGRSALIPCTGGWDEAVPFNDGPSSATIVPLGGTPPGGTVSVSGNQSIHAFPTDEDWYRFEPPSFGSPTTDMTVRLSVSDPASGLLRVELFQVSGPSRTLILSRDATGGLATFRYLFTAGDAYYLRISAVPPVAANDACYGSTINFVVNGPGPAIDRFEPDNTPGSPASLGVLNDSHTHFSTSGSQTEERWSKHLSGLSLHSASDSDHYAVRLPDPQDPAENGHTDIVECGTQTSGIGATTIFEGMAVARVTLPAGGMGRLDTFDPANVSRRFGTNVPCPRAALGSPFRLGVSVVPAAGQTQPTNYDLDLEYKIRITRQPPPWLIKLLGIDKRILATLAGPTGCFVPRCPPYKVTLEHVVNPPLFPECTPRCAEYSPIGLEVGGKFDVIFSSKADLSYQLLDRGQNVVLEGKPFGSTRGRAGGFVERMQGQITEPGLYVLRVAGPRAKYTMDPVVIPTGQRDITIDESRPEVPTGGAVRFTGLLQSSNPGCTAGKAVVLQASPPKEDAFKTVAKGTTGKAGAFSFSREITQTLDFRAVAPVSGSCLPATSAVTHIRVAPAG